MSKLTIPQDVNIPLDRHTAQYLAKIRYLRCTNHLPFSEKNVVRTALRRGLRQMVNELDFDMKRTHRAIQKLCHTKKG